MKRLGFGALLSFLLVGSLAAQNGSKRVDLKEITDGQFRQVTNIGEMRSMPDGEHYTAMNDARNMIIKYSYRTGNPVDTLFNTEKARECTFDKFDGYTISSTGHHILVWRDTEPIYRRSFKANVYDYDVRRNYVKPISDSKGKQMIPTFSPDGRMVAYVSDNNIWIRKFDYDTELLEVLRAPQRGEQASRKRNRETDDRRPLGRDFPFEQFAHSFFNRVHALAGQGRQ